MIEFDYSKIDWQKINNLIPVIVQHVSSGQVLMLGYMDLPALEQTLVSEKVTFYSRTKQRLWTKGESSGNFLQLKQITADCDMDSLLILAEPLGPTCHKGTTACFPDVNSSLQFIYELEQIIEQRQQDASADSYTAKLFASGTKRMAQKVGEEGVEVALAAATNDAQELINESADLLFHLLVLLTSKKLSLSDVINCLMQRHKQ